jgi:hypothetical protein
MCDQRGDNVADFNAVAKEVFQVLRSFDYTVQLYDENGMQVTEPEKTRRFMCHPKNLMVSLLDDDDNSRITLSIGKSTHINDVMGLNQKLRILATKYNMVFRTQQYGKMIDPKQFAELASLTEREDSQMQVCEGMYGTSRSSYLRLENARMIVRHKSRIDDSQIGARGRCVESIFVENAAGERGLMPTTNLGAARAMMQHINQGGGFADALAEHIKEMALTYGHLATGAQSALSEAVSLREACRAKMGKLRKTFERLSRPASYGEEAAELETQRNLLTETNEPIAEARIAEVRQLLQGEHDQKVYECCCKALDEMQPTPRDDGVTTKTWQEHVAWLKSFDPDHVLIEVWSPMDPSYSTDQADQAGDTALQNFDADEFVASPQMQDILSGRNPLDPEENELTRREIMQALEAYLRRDVERRDPNYTYDAYENTQGMAGAVYDAAVDALHRRGYVVTEANLTESHSEELTIEDILLPRRDQGGDLAGEVTKTDVADDRDPDQHGKPNPSYVSRLMTLAGMRTDY